MTRLWQDLRYGARMLRKNPGFTAVAVITLALGIGANTAMFSGVNAVLLRPLPYKDPDRLMVLSEWTKQLPDMSVSYPNFLDWRDQNRVFERMAAFQPAILNLTGRGEPERIRGRNVSANFFETLGVKPILGRDFLPEEDKPGGSPVVIASHGLWQRRFGGDPHFLGQTLTLNGRNYTVVGILPPDFVFHYGRPELFAPIGQVADQMMDRDNHSSTYVVARLRPGFTIEQARAEMESIARRLEQQYPKTNSGRSANRSLIRATRARLSDLGMKNPGRAEAAYPSFGNSSAQPCWRRPGSQVPTHELGEAPAADRAVQSKTM